VFYSVWSCLTQDKKTKVCAKQFAVDPTTFKVEENSRTFQACSRTYTEIQWLFKEKWNSRTFQGLPLKFKDFSRLCEPWNKISKLCTPLKKTVFHIPTKKVQIHKIKLQKDFCATQWKRTKKWSFWLQTHLDLSHSKLTKHWDSWFFLIIAGLAVDTLIKHSAQAWVGKKKLNLIRVMLCMTKNKWNIGTSFCTCTCKMSVKEATVL